MRIEIQWLTTGLSYKGSCTYLKQMSGTSFHSILFCSHDLLSMAIKRVLICCILKGRECLLTIILSE